MGLGIGFFHWLFVFLSSSFCLSGFFGWAFFVSGKGALKIECDDVLLQLLKNTANSLGRTPTKRDFPGWRRLTCHFGSWEKAVNAAGLVSTNSPEQHSIRAKQRKKKRMLASEGGVTY